MIDEAAVTQLESPDFDELQDHEFTLVGETDDVTQPASRPRAVPPPPKRLARAAQRQPREHSISGVYPTPAAESLNADIREELAATREELVRLSREMATRDAYLAQLESALQASQRELEASGLESAENVARLLGRLRGQAFRIAELEAELRQARAASAEQRGVRRTSLQKIRGIGPRFAERLAELGVQSVEAVAAWSEAEVARYADELGIARSRIERDAWVEQAKALL